MTEVSDLEEEVKSANEALEELGKAIDSFGATVVNSIGLTDTSGMASGGDVNNAYLAYVQHTSTGSGTSVPGYMGGGYTTPSIQITPGTFAPISPGNGLLSTFRCPMHVAEEGTIEFQDGSVVALCKNCQEPIQMGSIAGGMELLRIKYLLGVVMSIDEETIEVEGFDWADVLAEFSLVKERLETEEFAMKQARKLFTIAETLLAQKVDEHGEPDA